MDAAYDHRVRWALEEIVHSEVTVKEMKNHLKAKGIAVPSKNKLVATATASVNDMNEIAEAAAVASPKAQDGEDSETYCCTAATPQRSRRHARTSHSRHRHSRNSAE